MWAGGLEPLRHQGENPAAMAASVPPYDADVLEGLLAECLARLSQGEADPLEAVCGEHPAHASALRARQRGLAGMGLWQRPAADNARQFGPFTVVRELGRGGMGTVFLAHQQSPVRRLAAVKVITARSSPQALARFHTERQALAQLVHPHIAQVLEAGATGEGEPWYAMEFVDGEPLTTWCDRRQLALPARLALFLQLCEAVQWAHQQGVLHRDLKPGNVLVCERGGVPQVKVIDFGLAKALQEPFVERAELTEQGQILGTPEYMSPEQALPTAAGVDTRTDVYALGTMLYELCTGMLPFDFLGLRKQGFAALQAAVANQDAPPPSLRVQRLGEHATPLAERRGTSSTRLQVVLRGDLDWITGRALAKDRTQRYPSVGELAADVQRFLRHEPVSAGPPSALYQARKFVRRHRLGVAFATTVLLGLVGALAVTFDLYATGRRHLASFDSLQVTVDITALEREEQEDLWPAIAAAVPAMDRWLQRAEVIVQRLDEWKALLVDLRRRGTQDGQELHFRNPRDGYLHARLVPFLAVAERFAAADGVVAAVRARRALALDLRRQSVDVHADAWAATIAAVGDPERTPYRGMLLRPQTGLVPLGLDPTSRLAEFAVLHPRLRIPDRRDGRLVVRDDTAVVLVLIPVPEEPVLLGMAVPDERLPEMMHTEAEYGLMKTEPREGGCVPVALRPYFVAKHELTQGQWLAVMGDNPSLHKPPRKGITLAHPVDRISWDQAMLAARRFGLCLPTGAQWEHAARAGAEAPWWCGYDAEAWHGAENLADRSYEKGRGPLEAGVARYEPFDDTFALHAPVDALRQNPFGLHHVLGNVREWVATPYYRYVEAWPQPPDGDMVRRDPRKTPETDEREIRGGSFRDDWLSSRSTRRHSQPRNSHTQLSGVRLGRPLAED